MTTEGGYLDYLRRMNPSKLPSTLLGAALLLFLLSFFTGWFSVDTKAEVYDYDPGQPGGQGDAVFPVPPRVDVEMQLLSLETKIRPDIFDRRVEQDLGKPSYDLHAGRSGTVMLGVLILLLPTLLTLAALFGFYSWNRRSRRDLGHVCKRAGRLFLAVSLTLLLYFGLRIGNAAEKDTWTILDEYQPSRFLDNFPNLHPDHLRPRIEFWWKWTCCPPPEGIYPTSQGDKLVIIQVDSNPSAGFWLAVSATLLASTGFAIANRLGHFDPKLAPSAGTPPTAPATVPKVA